MARTELAMLGTPVPALVGTCTLDVTVAPGTVVCGHCDCGCDPASRAAVAGGAVIATSFVPTYVGHTVCGGWEAMWRRGRRRSRGATEEDPLPRLLTICLQSLPRFEPINSPQLFSEDRDGVGVPSITPILTLFCSVKRHSSPGTHSYAQLLCLVLSQQSRPAFVPPSECRVEIEIECRVSLELRSSLHAVCSERRCSDLCCSCPQ